MRIQGLLLFLALACIAQGALAERAWHGEGDVAYNKTSGNSDSETLMAKLKLIYEQNRWTHTGQLEAINSSEDDVRSAESYTARFKTDYDISEKYYAFGSGRYQDNRFSGYEFQASVITGLGVHLIATERTVLDLEGGVGYRRSEEQDTGETFNEAILTARGSYQYQLTETTRFDSSLSVESGADNTYVEGDLGIRVKINSALGLRVGYTVKHNTDVPADTDKTDTYTSVGLNYSF